MADPLTLGVLLSPHQRERFAGSLTFDFGLKPFPFTGARRFVLKRETDTSSLN
jgi:hypothetical protein